jgi:carbon-monoxide dehydrogenase medium subunit
MIPGPFAYHRPASVKEAVSLLVSLGEDARAIAGGHSLIPMMKLRLASPAHLIDLAGVADLKGIHEDGRDVVIGAMTTQHEVIGSELLANKVPILRETSFLIADPQVRYVGTLGGNVANGDPGNDMPAVMMCLNASYHAAGKSGERRIAALILLRWNRARSSPPFAFRHLRQGTATPTKSSSARLATTQRRPQLSC